MREHGVPPQAALRGGRVRGGAEGPGPGPPVPESDERGGAHQIALACSPAPEGHDHWKLRLLADRMVELRAVESLSHETVRLHLKKTRSSRGRRQSCASPR